MNNKNGAVDLSNLERDYYKKSHSSKGHFPQSNQRSKKQEGGN